jgi:FKBP-type peptidyl-prolyl cis-trans isomerase FkpA
MNKIKFYFIFLITTVVFISSCDDNDNNGATAVPPKPYAEQYAIDSLAIDEYLKTNYISEIVNNPGFPNDQDVTIKKIDNPATQTSLFSYLNSPTLPRLSSRSLKLHGLVYNIYTLVIREGVKGGSKASGGEYPCNVDAVFAGYKGTLLDNTVFDSSNNGQKQYNLDRTSDFGGIPVIRGWGESFPQFKTGWVDTKNDGSILYNDFGVGVMFFPSALGYYNNTTGSVPAYSPLVFSIKLYALKRFDQDNDGIPSFYEDLDGDRFVYFYEKASDNPDDTDFDGNPNYFDFDDDGDNYSTRGEVKDKNGNYYPFDLIPDCDGDQTKPDRLKRHLDPKCIKMSE